MTPRVKIGTVDCAALRLIHPTLAEDGRRSLLTCFDQLRSDVCSHCHTLTTVMSLPMSTRIVSGWGIKDYSPSKDTSPTPICTVPPQPMASPIRPAGCPLMKTEGEPFERARLCDGLPQLRQECSAKWSPTRSAGLPSISTVPLPSVAFVGGKWQSWPEPVAVLNEAFDIA